MYTLQNEVHVRKFNRMQRDKNKKIDLLETIENSILRSIVKERVYNRQDYLNYHDDSLCNYDCHSDHDDD